MENRKKGVGKQNYLRFNPTFYSLFSRNLNKQKEFIKNDFLLRLKKNLVEILIVGGAEE